MRSVFSKAIVDAAKADPKVLVLTGDHGYALFDDFRKTQSSQFINCGVAEQNMVGVAAGLAKAGFKPIVYGLSAFVPIRVLEQIKMDVCYENLPVVFIGDGAGFVYSHLGSSHQSTEDIAAVRSLSNIEIFSPGDPLEMDYVLQHAFQFKAPAYVRMGKSDLSSVHQHKIDSTPGNLLPLRQGKSKTHIIATGSMISTAVKIADVLGEISVWSAPSINPINVEQLLNIATTSDKIIVIEEHSIHGGLGGCVAELVCGSTQVIRFGVTQFSKKCGSYQYLLEEHELSYEKLLKKITQIL